MNREQIVNQTSLVREMLKTQYKEQVAFMKTIARIGINLETERMVKLAVYATETNKLVYSALMKTGTLLGYAGEESPYPADNTADVGQIQIPEYQHYPLSMTQGEARVEDVDIAIGGIKALRIQLQDMISGLNSFRVYEIADRNFVRLYDALTVELITAKHFLGLLLNELNKPVEFKQREEIEGTALPTTPFPDNSAKITEDMYNDNVESKLATNFKIESDDKADGFNIIDGRANPEEAIDKNE